MSTETALWLALIVVTNLLTWSMMRHRKPARSKPARASRPVKVKPRPLPDLAKLWAPTNLPDDDEPPDGFNVLPPQRHVSAEQHRAEFRDQLRISHE